MTVARTLYAACLAATLAGPALAGLYPTYPLGAVAGTWQVDRYAPADFSNAGAVNGRANALNLGIADADSLANRPAAYQSTFYNTQGRGFALDLPAYAVLYGSVYLPSAWTTSAGPSTNRRSDLWGVLSPAAGGDTCPASNCNLFPILGFTNADPVNPTTAGGTGRFRVWDTSIGYVDLATPVTYNQWTDACTVWTGTDIRHYLNGALVYTQTDLSQADNSFGPPNQWTRSITQAYNFGGANWSVNWAGLGSGQVTSTTTAGSGQSTPPGSAFPASLTLTVLDATGAPLPCVPVTFSAPGAGASASLSATQVLTDRNGQASVTATANGTLGPYTVTAQAAGGLPPASLPLANALAPPVVAATPVPATSPLVVALLGALLALAGAFLLRRRA